MCAVEWKKLGDVVQVLRGRRLTKTELLEEGQYPVFHGGLEPLGYYNFKNREADSVMVINVGASAGTVGYCDNDFWSSDGCFTLSKNPLLLAKYIYCYLKQEERKISSKVRKAGIPTLDAKVIEEIYIPLIDIQRQQEIVSQLDTFTTLISNLESELDMRRKQYEHYREVLFEEYEEYKVELGSFGQVEKAKNKKRITENAYSITQKGLVPTKDFFKEKTRVTSNDTSNYYIVQKNWFVYSPSRIDVGSINYLRDEGPAIVSPIDVVFSIDTNVCNPHFLLNYLQSQDGMFQILKYRIGVEGTGRRSLPFTDFAKIQVPLPPKQTQQQIVEKLDAFEQLIQSLETEIKLRKQQYEYYREKLLTFD